MNDRYEGQEVQNMNIESGTIALLNKSEIDMQITTAHKFPRSLKRFRDEALQMVTLNEAIAESCIYALPRDGKTIEGPSARFAEVVASAWGNCRAGARVVSDQGDFITAQGVFHDLERNVAITYEVQRRIVDKQGRRFKADMIGVTGNAASSIALRNAILKGVPKAFWDDMYQAARKTVMGDFKTLANRRADAMKAFVALGVTDTQIFAKLQVSGVEDIGLEHLVILRGLLTAIKEGDTTPEEAFAVEGEAAGKKEPQKDGAAQKAYPQEQFDKNLAGWRKLIADGKKTADDIIRTAETKGRLTDDQKAAIRNSTAGSQAQDAQVGAGAASQNASGSPGITYKDVSEKLQKAETREALDEAASLISGVPDDSQREDLRGIYNKRLETFGE